MSILGASAIVVAVATVAIAAMLLVRRRAPEGSYFADGDRAAGVFGVLATGFAVLAGFVVFLAFESYDTRAAARRRRRRIVAHQFETVQFLPPPARERLSGELVCYARNVVHQEWPRMASGHARRRAEPLGDGAVPQPAARPIRASATAQAAFSKYLDERSDREDARADRIHAGQGVIPAPLWIVLFLTAGMLFVFMLFFADSGERAHRPGDDDGRRGGRRHVAAAAALVPRQPVPRRRRLAQTGRDAEHAGPARRGGEASSAASRHPATSPARRGPEGIIRFG